MVHAAFLLVAAVAGTCWLAIEPFLRRRGSQVSLPEPDAALTSIPRTISSAAATSSETPARSFELLLFSTDAEVVTEASVAGIDGFIIDWERRGKFRRQAGEGTQINSDTLADLVRVRDATASRVICRLNGFGSWTRREIDLAVGAGADEVLLPMVREPRQVDAALRMVAGRCGLGILIETVAGVAASAELARRPLSRVYVGLNDLRIDRGSNDLFMPLVDGTVDLVRSHVTAPRFGVAGLTLPDRGTPVPSRLLGAELLRTGSQFTFLRRSFLADTVDRPLGPAVAAIRGHLVELAGRSAAEVQRDRDELVAVVDRSTARPA